MKKNMLLVLIGTVCFASAIQAAEEQWLKVSPGEYKGYAEIYVVSGGNYIIEGDTNLGGECTLTVSQKGVDCDGDFFSWDHPGIQASRETKEGRQRINFRGRVGNVIVADLTFEEVNGKIVRVMRMSVASK